MDNNPFAEIEQAISQETDVVRARAQLANFKPFSEWLASQPWPAWGHAAMWRAIVTEIIAFADLPQDEELAIRRELQTADAAIFLAMNDPGAPEQRTAAAKITHAPENNSVH